MGGTTRRQTIVLMLCACGFALQATRSLSAQPLAPPPTPAAPTPASRNVTADLIEDPAEPTQLEVYLASAMQPAPAARAPSLSTGRGSTGAAAASARPATNRLASAPEMFGDFFMSGGNLNFRRNDQNNPGGTRPPTAGSFTIPGAGGSRRVKIAENNKALPADRLIFSYNHFENALQFTENNLVNPGASIIRTLPIDRYTIGIEKTFLEGAWSAEVRMPFVSQFGFNTPDLTGASGNIGNLAVIVKHLLVEDNDFAVVIGMGIDIPTGNDFVLDDRSGSPPLPPSRFTFHNDSLHLLPYLGGVYAPDEQPYFVNGFIQVDVATNGNRIEAGPVGAAPALLGRFTEQNLLFLDLGTGYWLYRDDNADDGFLTNLAAILEFHFTTSLQDTDRIVATISGRPIEYMNNFNRFDIVNITTGLQARMWDNTNLRVAGVFPLGARDDQRFFDSEIQVQVNRQF